MTTAHCSAVTGSAYEAMMIACTWIGVRDENGRFRGEDGDGDGDGDDDVCEDVLEKEDKMQWKMVITFPRCHKLQNTGSLLGADHLVVAGNVRVYLGRTHQ